MPEDRPCSLAGLAAFLGCPRRGDDGNATLRYDTLSECAIGGARFTYLFRGKMMHQRRPRDGRTEEDDLHNGFFEGCARAGAWPDALVFSVGSHEAACAHAHAHAHACIHLDSQPAACAHAHVYLYQAIAWGKGPLPDYDLVRLQHDTRELLSWLRDRLGFGGRLLWYKPQSLGRYHSRNHSIRTFYDQAAQLMHQTFVRWRDERPDPALQLADFYQTTAGQRTFDGGHYHDLVPFHVNVLLHMLCHDAGDHDRYHIRAPSPNSGKR